MAIYALPWVSRIAYTEWAHLAISGEEDASLHSGVCGRFSKLHLRAPTPTLLTGEIL